MVQRLQAEAVGSVGSGVDLNEDRAVTELAAWFHVATVLLNLDETITRG